MLTAKESLKELERYKMNFHDSVITTYNSRHLIVRCESNRIELKILKNKKVYCINYLIDRYSDYSYSFIEEFLPIRIVNFINNWIANKAFY